MRIKFKLADYVVALLTTLDVATDIAVATQFYAEDRMLEYYVVAGAPILAGLIYSANFMLLRQQEPDWFRVLKPRYGLILGEVFQAAAVAIFCQFIPLYMWFTNQTFERSPKKQSNDGFSEENDLEVDRSCPGLLEALRESQNEVETIVELEQFVAKYKTTHWLFFVEAMVETILQNVLQLIAMMSVNKHPSALQQVSLAVSLLSLVSKAYIVARATNMKVFLCKLFMITHELFTLFYLIYAVCYSTPYTLRARTKLKLPWGGKIALEDLYWYVSWNLQGAQFILFTYTVEFVVTYRSNGDSLSRTLSAYKKKINDNHVWYSVVLVPLALLLFLPVVLSVALSTPSLAFGVLHLLEPPNQAGKWAAAVRLRRFVLNGKSNADVRRRHHHVLQSYIEERQASKDVPLTATEMKFQHALAEPIRQWSLWKSTWVTIRSFLSELPSNKCLPLAGTIAGLIIGSAVTLGCILGWAIPLFHFILYVPILNGFQIFSYYMMLLSSFGMFLLTPSVLRFIVYAVNFRLVFQYDKLSPALALKWMTDFYKPRNTEVFAGAVPKEIMPVEVAQRMGSFLLESAVDKTALTAEESLRLKQV